MSSLLESTNIKTDCVKYEKYVPPPGVQIRYHSTPNQIQIDYLYRPLSLGECGSHKIMSSLERRPELDAVSQSEIKHWKACILGIKIKDSPPWLTHLQEMTDPLGWMDSCNHSLISKSYTYSMRDNVVVRIQLSSGFATKNYQEKDLGHLWLCCWDLICIIEEKRLLVDVSSIYAQVIQTGTSS